MKFKRSLLLLALLVLPGISMAQDQQKLDSLINIYSSQPSDSNKVNNAHAIFDFYYGHNPNKAIEYSKEALELSQKIKYKSGMAKSFSHLGNYFMNTREIDSANLYYQKSFDLYNGLKDTQNAGLMSYKMIQLTYLTGNYDKALNDITYNMEKYTSPNPDSLVIMKLHFMQAKVYMRQSSYKKGFESILTALSIAENLKLENDQVLIKGTLASLYHYTNNREKSIEIKKELLVYYRKKNNKRKIGLTLNDIGNSNYVIENYDIALKYLNESLTYSQEIKDQGLIGITLFNIGKTHVKKGSVEKGIDYLKKSIYHSQHVSHNPLSESWALKRLGSVYTEELEQPEKALPYLNRAIMLADSVGNKDDLYQSYRDRSHAYAALGSYKKAFSDHQIYKAINDSVYNIERSKDIERLKTEFETKEKEQQIVIQENEIGLLEQKEKVSQLQKSLLGGGLLLSLGLIGLGVYGFRQRIKRNTLEKEKLDAELDFKRKELTTHALHLARKNEVLEALKLKAEELKISENGTNGYQQLIRTINFDLQDDNNWQNFSNYFQEVHKDFNSNVKRKFPEVTSNELRLMSLLKMNLSSKEIANILNISQEGIKKARYRLRKKLDITTEDSLQDLVLSL